MGFDVISSGGSRGDEDAGTLPVAKGSGGAALDRALSKVGRRIIPLVMGIAIANHMDRSK
jgi:hypothetical protein